MRYRYTDEDIKKDIEVLEEMMDKSKNKAYYKKIIDDITTSLNETYLCNIIVNQPNNAAMFDLLDKYYKDKRYYDLLELFGLETRADTARLYKEAMFTEFQQEYYKHEDCMTIVHDFYKNLDSELYDAFLNIYNNRYKTIRFNRDVDPVNGMESDGYCMFVDKLYKNYITVRSEYGINKLISLAHECGHGIFNILNPKAYTLRIDHYSTEIATLFLEQVFSYEVLNALAPFESAYINLENLNDNRVKAYYLGCHDRMIESWKECNNKVDKYFFRSVKDKTKLTREQTLEAMALSICDDGIYLVGYMVSLELFNMYKKDKEKTLYLLKQMEAAKPCDTLIMLDKYMPKYTHIGEEIDSINENMCKQLLKRPNK